MADLDDRCAMTANPAQADIDIDGVGNACDDCLNDPNPAQADRDGGGIGDACDANSRRLHFRYRLR